MCGIVGVYRRDGKVVDKDQLRSMAGTISHRGPDDEGSFFADGVGLWHKRLSIIDLAKGHQPIFNQDRSKLIIYNGEVYNYQEIRADLEKKGHRFRTETDTEVVLHAYEEYGEDAVKRFNGMFAFAIYDLKDNSLFLARDRLGIKPLYYFYDDERLIFASEIKAIIEDRSVPRVLDRKTVVEYLMFQMVLDEKTFYRDVRLLKPAHFMHVSSAGVRVKRYWDVDFSKTGEADSKDVSGYLSRFRGVLERSVRRHMIADVPVGAYLSGGFDSTSVAVTAAGLSDKRLSTFTGAYAEGPDFDERPRSRKVAKMIGAHLHEKVIEPEDFRKNLRDVMYHIDEPKVGSPAIAQFLVSRMVSKHVKVCLTGHGGDELFAGYPNHKAIYFRSEFFGNPFRIFRLLRNIRLHDLVPIGYFLLYPLVYPELRYGIMVVFDHKELKRLLRPDFYRSTGFFDPTGTVRTVIGKKRLTSMQALSTLFMKSYLPSLFIIEDKVSMASSIESRVPLCDNEMVEFSLSVPDHVKMHDNIQKYVIKEAMRKKLPKALYHAKKMGFPTAFPVWYRSVLKDDVHAILFDGRLENRGIFDMGFVRELFDDHVSGKKNNECKLWSLISIEMWFRIFMDRAEGSAKPVEGM